MGRIKKGVSGGLRYFVLGGVVAILLFLISGCSTASWIVHHNGTADTLLITKADVDTALDELSTTHPDKPYEVLYNTSTKRYELTPDVYKKALRDGIIRRIQDRKIERFLNDYRPETLMDALRKDLGTTGIFIILLGVLGGLFY